MKRFAIVSLLSLCASGVYAQGTLQFYNTFGSTAGSEELFQVYAPQVATPGVEIQGPTAAQITADGSGNLAGDGENSTPTTYTGIAIGGAADPSPSTSLTPGTINYTYGNDFTAEIYALSAGTQTQANTDPIPAFSSLLPVSQYFESFSTTSANLNEVSFGSGNPDPGIPGTGLTGAGTRANPYALLNNAYVAVAVWYNAGGTVTSLNQAIADHLPNGVSAVQVIEQLGEPASVETALTGTTTPATFPAVPYYLESFSTTTAVPEPGSIALGLMGVCGFLARRRKK